MDTKFWNIMHDGRLQSAEGQVPGSILMKIGIGFLCKYLPTASDGLRVELLGCRLFTFTPYDEPTITDLDAIVARDIEILSADLRSDRISVSCAGKHFGGTLDAAYESVRVSTSEGTLLSQLELELAANRSVDDWVKRDPSEPTKG